MIVVRTNIHKHETSTFKKINAPVREKKKPVIGRILECISKQNTLCFNHTSFSPFYLKTGNTNYCKIETKRTYAAFQCL